MLKTNFTTKVAKGILLVAVLMLSSCGFEIVDTGYRGIETRFGEVVGSPLPEGLHFYNPFTTNITEFKVQQETWNSSSAIFTKDNQRVDVKFAITFAPNDKAVTSIYKDVGREEALIEKIIKPTVLGSLQSEIGKIVADEVNQKKDTVSKTALATLKDNLAAKNVLVLDLNLTDVDFDDAYEKAAEAKVVAIQEAAKAKNETVKIEEEAKQSVVTAKAQAEAMRIQSEALSKNQNLIQYELAKKWDGKLPQYQFGSSVPLIDMKSLGK